eukprot:SAG11_NODE_4591_length_1840_cov_2.064331_3_plen_54_part_00
MTDRESFIASGETVRGVLEGWWGKAAVAAIPGIELCGQSHAALLYAWRKYCLV